MALLGDGGSPVTGSGGGRAQELPGDEVNLFLESIGDEGG